MEFDEHVGHMLHKELQDIPYGTEKKVLTGIMIPEGSLPPGYKHAMPPYPEQEFSNHAHNLPLSNLKLCYPLT